MILKDTTSCAMQEINGLMQFSGNPKGAMQAFCRLTFDENGETSARYGVERTYTGSLYSFYLFSAAVEMTGRKQTGYYAPYAQDFAKFITENKLGEVWSSPVKQNKTFHTSHGNQIYVWTIDQDAIKKWWEKNKQIEDKKSSLPDEDYQIKFIDWNDI